VSDAAILNGCRADLAIEMGDLNKGQAYQNRFQADLTGMLHVEMGRRSHRSPRMASVYTRHRVARTLRGFGGRVVDDRF
jgi:hypothetical protein